MNFNWLPLISFSLLLSITSLMLAEDSSPEEDLAKLAKAKKNLTSEQYRLQYKFQVGEQLRYKIVQRVTVETRIKGTLQTNKSRSISTKLWRVVKTDPQQGEITFEHVVEDVDMWRQGTGRQEVRYNSKTDKKPPAEYEKVAKNIAVVLTTVTIDTSGKIIARKDRQKKLGKGGQLITPLPAQKVKIGDHWFHPQEVVVKYKDGRLKQVKIRQRFRLEKVTDNIAEISVRMQILTPVNDPSLRYQLISRLSHGHVMFDIATGRVIKQELALNETVLSFSGPESIMKYVGSFTEELLAPSVKTATKPEGSAEAELLPREDRKKKPVLRR